jgi:hypothetical protein
MWNPSTGPVRRSYIAVVSNIAVDQYICFGSTERAYVGSILLR